MIDPDKICFDRQGNNVSIEEWGDIHLADKIVAQEQVGDYFISTVWIGIDMNYSDEGPPLIFETMVFNRSPGSEVLGDEEGCWRWATEEEAHTGHRMLVFAYRTRL
jgi:hypothetical protein